MNRILLDTHTFIWFVANDVNLPPSIREEIEYAEEVFLSIASIWEIAIKVNIGKLTLKGNFEDIESQLITADINILHLTFKDTVQVRHLPLHHRDPFDRIIVAQTINHSLVLISRDLAFDAYSIQRFWS